MRMRGWSGILLLALAASSAAQERARDRVAVTGRVHDASTHRPLAGAEIVLHDAGGDSARALTSSAGVWRLDLAPSQTYRGRVRALGFKVGTIEITIAETGTDVPRVIELTPLALALDRVVVTAARREQRLADVVVTTELVSADDIARTGASDLGSALAAATGIQLDGGTPAGTGIMLQGLGSERVLILLDGQPMPGRIAGEFDVSRMPTAIIDRVEIVKGPQSAVYGTDAMGGVVNVITRRANVGAPFASMSLIAGSRERRDGTVALGATIGPVSVRGDAGRRSMRTAPGRADERGALAERTDASLSATWRPAEGSTVELGVLALDERQRWLAGLYNFSDNLQVSSRLSAERASTRGGRWRFSAFGSVYDHLSRASSLPQPIRGDTGQRQVQRLFQGELAWSRPLHAHVLDVSMQARHDDTESVRIPGGRRSLVTVEPAAQFEAALTDQLAVVTGARLSYSDRWGTHLTPRVALRYRPLDELTVRVSGGAGFRAPDFRELYMRFQNPSAGYAVYGNEHLRPERSRNITAGAEWAARAGFVRGHLFHNEFSGFIEARVISDPDAPPVYEYANVDDGFTRGVELEGGMTAGRLRVDAGYGFLQTLDRTNDVELLGRPTHTARASVALPLPLLMRASMTGLYTGRTAMRREGRLITGWRDAYPRLDLRLARPLPRDVELALNVENVFDRRPAEWAGFTGRQMTVSLGWDRSF